MNTVITSITFACFGGILGYLFAHSRSVERTAALKARLQEQQRNAKQMAVEFERLSRSTLKEANHQLLQTAESVFKQAQTSAKGELDQQRLQIQHLVEPMKEDLNKLHDFITASDNERKAEWGGLSEQMRQVAQTNMAVHAEAAALKNVLRSSSASRGRIARRVDPQ